MMNDIFALLSLWIVVALVLALCAGNIIAYAREEWRRMRAHTWAPDEYP